MMQKLDEILNAYLSSILVEVQKGAPATLLSNPDQLATIIKEKEKGHHFKALRKALSTQLKLKLSSWQLSTYFRRSGVFEYIISKLDIPTDSLKNLIESINNKDYNVSLILPLPYVSFATDEIDFKSWRILRPDRTLIETYANNNTNRLFYPSVMCDISLVTQLHYIWVDSSRENRIDNNSFHLDLSGSIDWDAHNLPSEMITPYHIFILFRWEDTQSSTKDWIHQAVNYIESQRRNWWLPFDKPKSKMYSESPFSGYQQFFDIDMNWFEERIDHSTDEFIGYSASHAYYLYKAELNYFIDYAKDMNKRLDAINSIHNTKIKEIFETALDYFSRASFSNGLEQLVWFISTLEILLAPSNQELISETVARRSAILLGDNLDEKKAIHKLVKKLYGIRSKVVHGSRFKKNQANQTHLFYARNIARRVLTWFISFYSVEISKNIKELITRDELHKWIDYERQSLPDPPL